MVPKEKYQKLKGKYPKLPDWEWLNKNFRFKFEDDVNILEQVRIGASEKLDTLARSIIEPIISGGESYCCYFERKMLSEEQREGLFDIYRALQALLWRSNALSVDFSERAVADWLADVKGGIEKSKPKMLAICSRLSEGWLSYKKERTETAYHG